MTDMDRKFSIEKVTEADVEIQVIFRMLTDEQLFELPLEWIKGKVYIQPLDIGKGTKRIGGYIPDFLIVVNSIPIAVIEAKTGEVSSDIAYGEASQYAHELNRRFPSDINPCHLVIGCNGTNISLGYWDGQPVIRSSMADIQAGSNELTKIQDYFSKNQLISYSNTTSARLRLEYFKRPFNRSGGQAMIYSKMARNSFTNEISPILTRYFSSQSDSETKEIWTKGYISSNEVTSYDRTLEALLKDRAITSNKIEKISLDISKKKQQNVEMLVKDFVEQKPQSGFLQIITGSVGAGKSLFMRRYKELLQPPEVDSVTHWSFIDFNNVPADLSMYENWVCENFITSLCAEGMKYDLTEREDQERIFADKLRERRAHYERMNEIQSGRGDLEKARDIEEWRVDASISAKSLCRFLQGDKNEVVVIVFDNVDRKGTEEQLKIFQLAMWLKEQTRALIIIQLRDVTFERYKNEPPLDTFKTGAVFHVTPPRFIDVVGKRLELSLEFLSKNAPDTFEFITNTGLTVQYPRDNAGQYLKSVYTQIFNNQKNISRLLEALSNKNVRSSLDMFMSILTSGHMNEDSLNEKIVSNNDFFLREHILIRTLMRTDYRFYHDTSGTVANLFFTNASWERPTNFHVVEVLFFLFKKRKITGDNGLSGYLSIVTVINELSRKGFTAADVSKACEYALQKGLIEADNLSLQVIENTTCLKIAASGFIHMRFLTENIEYLSSILYTTPINDDEFGQKIFEAMRIENANNGLSLTRRANLVEEFSFYLKKQSEYLKSLYIGAESFDASGMSYVIEKVEKAAKKFRKENPVEGHVGDLLDDI